VRAKRPLASLFTALAVVNTTYPGLEKRGEKKDGRRWVRARRRKGKKKEKEKEEEEGRRRKCLQRVCGQSGWVAPSQIAPPHLR